MLKYKHNNYFRIGDVEMIKRLIMDMIEYCAGDPKRIQHFLKVHELAGT